MKFLKAELGSLMVVKPDFFLDSPSQVAALFPGIQYATGQITLSRPHCLSLKHRVGNVQLALASPEEHFCAIAGC